MCYWREFVINSYNRICIDLLLTLHDQQHFTMGSMGADLRDQNLRLFCLQKVLYVRYLN